MARSAVPSRSSSRDEDLIQIDPDFYRNSLPGTLEREREIYYDVEVLAFAANYSALVLLVVSQCGNSIVVICYILLLRTFDRRPQTSNSKVIRLIRLKFHVKNSYFGILQELPT